MEGRCVSPSEGEARGKRGLLPLPAERARARAGGKPARCFCSDFGGWQRDQVSQGYVGQLWGRWKSSVRGRLGRLMEACVGLIEVCVGVLGDGSLFTGHLPQRWLWHFAYDVPTLTPTHPVGASPSHRGRNKAIQPVSSEFTNSSHLCCVCPWFTDALSIFFPATSTHFHAGAQPWTCPRSCLPNALPLHPAKHLGGSPWLPRPPSLLYSEELPSCCASRCQIIDFIESFPL